MLESVGETQASAAGLLYFHIKTSKKYGNCSRMQINYRETTAKGRLMVCTVDTALSKPELNRRKQIEQRCPVFLNPII